MANEYTLSEKEKSELLNSRGKQVCKSCGLVMLRNRATDWCVEKGCNYSDHTQYESAMKRLTKRKC